LPRTWLAIRASVTTTICAPPHARAQARSSSSSSHGAIRCSHSHRAADRAPPTSLAATHSIPVRLHPSKAKPNQAQSVAQGRRAGTNRMQSGGSTWGERFIWGGGRAHACGRRARRTRRPAGGPSAAAPGGGRAASAPRAPVQGAHRCSLLMSSGCSAPPALGCAAVTAPHWAAGACAGSLACWRQCMLAPAHARRACHMPTEGQQQRMCSPFNQADNTYDHTRLVAVAE